MSHLLLAFGLLETWDIKNPRGNYSLDTNQPQYSYTLYQWHEWQKFEYEIEQSRELERNLWNEYYWEQYSLGRVD